MINREVREGVVLSYGEHVLKVCDRLVDYHFIRALELIQDQLVVLEERSPTLVVVAELGEEPLLCRPIILSETLDEYM